MVLFVRGGEYRDFLALGAAASVAAHFNVSSYLFYSHSTFVANFTDFPIAIRVILSMFLVILFVFNISHQFYRLSHGNSSHYSLSEEQITFHRKNPPTGFLSQDNF